MSNEHSNAGECAPMPFAKYRAPGKQYLAENKALSDFVAQGAIDKEAAIKIIKRERQNEFLEERDALQKEFEDVHRSPITLGADGRWKTRLRLPNGKLRQIAKSDLAGIEFELHMNYCGRPPYPAGHDSKKFTTLRELFPDWIEEKEKYNSPSTIKSYQNIWKGNIEPYREIIDVPIRNLSVPDLKDWQLDILDGGDGAKPMKIKRFYNIRAMMNSLFDKAVEEGIVETNVSEKAKIPNLKARKAAEEALRKGCVTEQNSGVVVFSEEELQKVKATGWKLVNNKSAKNPLNYLMLLFAAETGLRTGELLALKPEDVQGDTLTVRRFYAYTEDVINEETGEKTCTVKNWLKNYKEKRSIPLTRAAQRIVRKALRLKQETGQGSEYLFSKTSDPVKYSTANSAMMMLCKAAGIPKYRIYAFRKTWITKLVDSGKFTLAQISRMAGNTPTVIMRDYYGDTGETVTGSEIEDALCEISPDEKTNSAYFKTTSATFKAKERKNYESNRNSKTSRYTRQDGDPNRNQKRTGRGI